METVSSPAIILKHQDYQERDRILTFLTRERGRVRGIVKGSRKLTSRGVGNFEPLAHGVMHYVMKPTSELVAIRKCDPLPPYLYLQQSYEKIIFASYLSELINLCEIEAAESEAFYTLLLDALQALCDAQSARQLPLIRLRFELKFLRLLGQQPDWQHCGVCAGPLFAEQDGHWAPLSGEPHQFDLMLGGVRHPACRDSGPGRIELGAPSLGFLMDWMLRPTLQPPRPTLGALAELEEVVTRHLIHQLEREPRSLAMLPPLADLQK